ncbi:tolB protein precursor [Hyphomicrobium sulfonivorans]|uniref:Tol-Pal system protein TolB n=2 Tax=Hyphomicrobium sulfonivorans TaxID=121290 RepID=A0A109B8I5_HYPSL|nr:tolB protein precursor [Hyphomicrobium sulfonivorans]
MAFLMAGVLSTPVFAQRPDDSYKGPGAGGGFDSQLQQMQAPPPQMGGGGGGLSGGTSGGGGLQGRQTQGTIAPIPIAIPFFLGPDPKLAADVAEVVTADLGGSGLFDPLDRASFLEQVRDVNAAPRFGDWRAIRADALVVGDVARGPDGRIIAQFRLWDVTTGKQLAGQRFATAPQNWRRVGHIIADQVYKQLTGESGYFDSRVVYVDETGPKDRRVKRLAIMDQDGHNVRLLTKGNELVLTPRFSPTNQEITFMSYTSGQPRVFLMNLETGQREVVGDFPGMTFAPRFSPDGQRIVMSLQSDGNSAIFEMDLRSRQRRQLTPGTSIDTGPSYSPDGRQIVFETDREGTQQIYVMNSDGSGAHRISRGEGRYSTPVWSPRGDYIAFTKQYGGRFLIGVMRPDGTGERVLTEGYHNEGPTWAPNGRVLMFFRESQGANGGARIFSVDLTGYNERIIRTPSFASDPAWSPLLN